MVLAGLIIGVACGAIVDVLERRSVYPDWRAMVAAQFAHGLVLLALAASLSSAARAETLIYPVLLAIDNRDVLLYLCVYVGAVAGGDVFVQTLTAIFAEQIPELKENKPGLQNAGRYIGWLERSPIITFIVGGYGDAVGFLIATKALARFPTIKSDTRGRFTDYFLVGTLTSVGLALFGGILLRIAGLTLAEPS